MAKFGSGSWKIVLVDGFNLLTAKVKNISRKVENMLEPSHGLGDDWTETTPVGLRTATLTQDGAFFDSATDSIHVAMKDQAGAIRIVCVGEEGNTIGAHFTGWEGAVTVGYEAASPLGGLVKANAMYQMSGAQDDGIIVQNRVAKTIDWDTKATSVDYTLDPAQRVIPITSSTAANPAVLTTPVPHGLVDGQLILISGHTGTTPTINGARAVVTALTATTFSINVDTSGGVAGAGGSFVSANSLNGGVGYQHVTDLTGFTGFIGKILHSPDDVTYADKLAFANVTTVRAAERVTVSGTTDRYVAFEGNITGVGSLMPFAGFKRS